MHSSIRVQMWWCSTPSPCSFQTCGVFCCPSHKTESKGGSSPALLSHTDIIFTSLICLAFARLLSWLLGHNHSNPQKRCGSPFPKPRLVILLRGHLTKQVRWKFGNNKFAECSMTKNYIKIKMWINLFLAVLAHVAVCGPQQPWFWAHTTCLLCTVHAGRPWNSYRSWPKHLSSDLRLFCVRNCLFYCACQTM